MSCFVLKGNIAFSESKDVLKTIDGFLVCVDGYCKGVYETLPLEYQNYELFDYTDKLIIPGMVDLHIHACQYAYRGLGMDYELLDWLKYEAFVEEAKFADLDYSKKAYEIFVDNIVKSATTRLSIFASRHTDATILLMELLEKSGLVSYVGKINMDRDAPYPLVETNSYKDTIRWLEETKSRFINTYHIITPRFIPSCSDDLMYQLGELVKEYKLPLQSHLSENLGEIELVASLCPNSRFYGDAYDEYQLFGKNSDGLYPTIMAHCIYSNDEEVKMMKDRGIFIAHCPSSNMNVSSGIAPIRKYLDLGLNVGLGSDVAGGTSESLFQTLTKAIEVSKLYWRLVDQNAKALSFKEAFYMATMGGGKFFGHVGSFKQDYEFDALILDDSILKTTLDLSIAERVERAIYLSLDLKGGVIHKFVKGKMLF